MSVTVRPYVNGGWEVDIRVELPDGTDHSRAEESLSREQDRGATLGRGARASVAGRRQAEAGHEEEVQRHRH